MMIQTKLMTRFKLLLLSFLLICSTILVAQDYSNKGKEFWIAYPAHIDGSTGNMSSVMGLYITSDVNTSGVVQVGSGPSINFTVTANQITKLFLGSVGTVDGPNSPVYLDMADGIKSNAAIKITSQESVVVYSHIIQTARSGAALALPTPVLGNEYIVSSIANHPTSNNNARNNGTVSGVGEVAVIATQANTTIEITPSITGLGGRPAGVPFTVTLQNPGDCYQFQGIRNGDVSGTKVRSISSGTQGCKPIAVFSATSWSAFGCTTPNPGSGDNLYQQLFPVRAWGKNFLTAPAITRSYDIFRVFVSDPTTVVNKTENGVTQKLTNLVNNSYYEYQTGSATYIQTDKPSSVVQYFTTQACTPGAADGDPEMVILNPVEQTINNITVFSAHENWVPPNQSDVRKCYLNIIIPTSAKSTFKINGNNPTGSFIAIPGTSFSYLQEDVTAITIVNPIQTLKADSGFIAIAYGFGPVESYGYNAGTNVKDFSRQATFANPYSRIDSAVTCVNTPVQFSVPLSFQPTTVRWDFTAAPNINPNATISFNTNPVADSTPIVSGQTLYYFSPGQTFSFTNANTVTVRDTVKLYTTSSTPDGCGSTDQVYSIPVKVIAKNTTDFFITSTGCVNESVKLSPSTGSGIQYFWDTGDGKTFNFNQSNEIFNYSFTQAGDYTIKLRAVSSIGCISDDAIKTVSISAKPTASFSYSTIRCANTDITFTDASTTQAGTIAKWTWDLDNGVGPLIANTNAARVTRYISTGTKNTTLQVETSTGCKSDVFTPSTALFVNPLPEPGFILPEVCLNDASALFTDTSKIADGSEVQFSYLWNFNAGTPAVNPGPNITSSTLKNPQVKYNKSDNYSVTLRVTSKDGCVNTATQSFTVNGSIPKADFEVQMNTVLCSKVPIVILNKSTVDFGAVTKSEIYWDRVNKPTQVQTDDNPALNKAYSNLYNVTNGAGENYNIRLVSYSGGNTCVSEVTKTITVHPNPKAAYTVSSADVCFDEPVSFIDQSATISLAPPTRWIWDLGKGNSSGIQNPARAYQDSGSFNTSLHVYSAAGCGSDTASITLTVYPLPVLIMGTKSTAVLEGGEVKLKPSFVYGNMLSYLWTPSMYLSSDTAFSPVSKPVNDITYTLTVLAEGGCSVSDTIFIKVLKSPEVPNAFSPNGDGVNDTWNIKYLESYPGATVDVFNRYGQIVYRSLGYTRPWDGRVQGSPLPIGTYYYIINPKNGKPPITGSITIIR